MERRDYAIRRYVRDDPCAYVEHRAESRRSPCIAEQLENTWRVLIRSPRLQRVFLCPDGRIRLGDGLGSVVGWFDARVSLCDFRVVVLHCYEAHRRAHVV